LYTSAVTAARTFNPGKAPNAGDLFEGTIEQMATTPYTIGEGPDAREVEKITVVCFADEKAWEVANAQLAKNEASVLINGKPSVIYGAEKLPENQPKGNGKGAKATA
jgi:hypothetical protein